MIDYESWAREYFEEADKLAQKIQRKKSSLQGTISAKDQGYIMALEDQLTDLHIIARQLQRKAKRLRRKGGDAN